MNKWLYKITSFLGLHTKNIKATPVFIQMENAECGAVCLQIILAYYGRYVPIQELRSACDVSRDGCSAYNIANACPQYGLNCEGYSYTIKELENQQFPMIVFWGFEHFVVLEGIRKGKYYINDPRVGRVVVGEAEFKINYTGVILQVTPNETFIQGVKQPRFFASLRSRLKGLSTILCFFSLVELGLVFLNLVAAVLAQVFVDHILSVQLPHWRWWFFGITLSVFILIAFVTVFKKWMLVKLQVKLATQYSADFFQRIFMLPIAFYEQRYASEIAYRSSLNQEIADFITGNLYEAAIQMVIVIVYAAALFFYSPSIAAVGVFFATFNVITVILIHKRRLGIYARYQQEMGKTASFSISALDGFETWKCLGCENRLFAWLAAYYTRTFNVSHQLQNVDVILANLAVFSRLIANTALFALGGWYVIQGTLTPGQFFALFLLMSNFLVPIANLVEINQNFELFRVDVARLDDVMQNPVDWQYHPRKIVSSEHPFIGHIEMRHVTYQYNHNLPPTLDNINLLIEPGKCVALVGPSGSGKTTIQKLLAGLILPASGEVLIDGKNLQEHSATYLSQYIGFVFADAFIFAETVKRNVTLYDVNISDAQIKQAMLDACLWERFSEGNLQNTLEEKGRNISGGEQQRLEIARCLVRNPAVIVLDEATSALDETTEAMVLNNIKKRGCTMILLTHRLSAINICDEVLVLDHGTIIQKGTPKELANTEGLFKKLLLTETA